MLVSLRDETDIRPEMAPRHADAADHAACRAAIRTGSRSFYAASALLTAAVRQPAYGLYAFCRLSDDAVDDVAPENRATAVVRLSERLARVYAGLPMDGAADRALADIVVDHAIPQTLPAALIEGLAWDGQGRRYETLSDLTAYATRVAASVGATMTLIMGVRDPHVLARACDLGLAMQFTNIARDVGEDARAGRLYLPLAWLREAGIDPDGFMADPVLTPPLQGVIARLLAVADGLYLRAEAGIGGLPFACRPAIRAARLIYAEIGRDIERAGYDSIGRRARISGRHKAVLMARATLPLGGDLLREEPPVPEIAFLLAAVAAEQPEVAPRSLSWWNLPGQFVRVLDLIEVLREREGFASEVGSPAAP